MAFDMNEYLEIVLPNDDTFLKVKETLSRIGISSKTDNILFQSCHILHKQGKYYLVHFKELHKLDGKPDTMSLEDEARRNTIASLLQDWKLLTIVDDSKIKLKVNLNKIKIIKFSDKKDWKFVQKYTLGKYKK